MAESVTPRTPRQAAEACRTCGDSGLVPNGLASNGPDPCPHCVPLTEWAYAAAQIVAEGVRDERGSRAFQREREASGE